MIIVFLVTELDPCAIAHCGFQCVIALVWDSNRDPIEISVGSLLDLYCISVGSLYWISIGSPLDLYWISIGSPLDLCWISIGSLLHLHWISFGSLLDIYASLFDLFGFHLNSYSFPHEFLLTSYWISTGSL